LFVSFAGLSLGVMQWADWIARAATTLRASDATASTVGLAAVLVAVTASGLIDGARVAQPTLTAWREQAELGRWIGEQFGPGRTITSNNEDTRLAMYYAGGRRAWIADQYVASAEAAAAADRSALPELVVLWPQQHRPDAAAVARNILRVRAELGYVQVPSAQLPERCRHLTVLVQERCLAREHADAPRQPLFAVARQAQD
jgi:hypothetical protein